MQRSSYTALALLSAIVIGVINVASISAIIVMYHDAHKANGSTLAQETLTSPNTGMSTTTQPAISPSQTDTKTNSSNNTPGSSDTTTTPSQTSNSGSTSTTPATKSTTAQKTTSTPKSTSTSTTTKTSTTAQKTTSTPKSTSTSTTTKTSTTSTSPGSTSSSSTTSKSSTGSTSSSSGSTTTTTTPSTPASLVKGSPCQTQTPPAGVCKAVLSFNTQKTGNPYWSPSLLTAIQQGIASDSFVQLLGLNATSIFNSMTASITESTWKGTATSGTIAGSMSAQGQSQATTFTLTWETSKWVVTDAAEN